MNKARLLIGIVIISLLVVVVGACAQPTQPQAPEGDGTITVFVTDAPPDSEVTSVMVTLAEVQVHKVSATQEQEQLDDAEWITIDMSGNTTFDLLQIQGIEQFLGTGDVEAGKYTQVRLVIDEIQVRLNSGNLTNATLPSGELKLVHPFDIIAGEGVALVIDFDADKMVTVTGAGKINVKPVIRLITRKEKPSDRDEKQEKGEALTPENTVWVLESYGDPDDLNSILEDTEITAELSSTEKRVSGSAGCNKYFAGYEINQNELTLTSPVGSTRMACPEAVMNQEAEYLEILQNIESFDIEGDQLRIVSGDKVLLFEGK